MVPGCGLAECSKDTFYVFDSITKFPLLKALNLEVSGKLEELVEKSKYKELQKRTKKKTKEFTKLEKVETKKVDKTKKKAQAAVTKAAKAKPKAKAQATGKAASSTSKSKSELAQEVYEEAESRRMAVLQARDVEMEIED
jgi:hypothetical protein